MFGTMCWCNINLFRAKDTFISIFNFIEKEGNTNSRTFTSSLSLLYFHDMEQEHGSLMIWNKNIK